MSSQGVPMQIAMAKGASLPPEVLEAIQREIQKMSEKSGNQAKQLKVVVKNETSSPTEAERSTANSKPSSSSKERASKTIISGAGDPGDMDLVMEVEDPAEPVSRRPRRKASSVLQKSNVSDAKSPVETPVSSGKRTRQRTGTDGELLPETMETGRTLRKSRQTTVASPSPLKPTSSKGVGSKSATPKIEPKLNSSPRRGRPRKIVEEESKARSSPRTAERSQVIAAKSESGPRRGRPPKTADSNSDVAPVSKRGRNPKLKEVEVTSSPVLKMVTSPKTTEDSHPELTPSRISQRGRPQKIKATDSDFTSFPLHKRARPPKTKEADTKQVSMKKTPIKMEHDEDTPSRVSKRGRPPKIAPVSSPVSVCKKRKIVEAISENDEEDTSNDVVVEAPEKVSKHNQEQSNETPIASEDASDPVGDMLAPPKHSEPSSTERTEGPTRGKPRNGEVEESVPDAVTSVPENDTAESTEETPKRKRSPPRISRPSTPNEKTQDEADEENTPAVMAEQEREEGISLGSDFDGLSDDSDSSTEDMKKLDEVINELTPKVKSEKSSSKFRQCPLCLESFNNSKILTKHRKICFLQCDSCNTKFKQRYLYVRHKSLKTGCGDAKKKALIEQGKSPITCDECGNVFSSIASLRNHMQRHEVNEKDLICESCNAQFKKLHNLKAHVKVCQSLICNKCGRNFKSKHMYKRHTSKKGNCYKMTKPDHADPNSTPQCEVCGRVFKNHRNLKPHLITHQTDKPHKCGECPRTFTSKASLRSHITFYHRQSRTILCSLCGQKFCNHDGLRYHMKSHIEQRLRDEYQQSMSRERPDLATKESATALLTCLACTENFSKPFDWFCHLKRHLESADTTEAHQGVIQDIVDKHNREYEKLAMPCRYCQKVFFKNCRLKYHMEQHRKAGDTESADGAPFRRIKQNESHTCEYCPAKFVTKASLKVHLQYHTKEFDFNCTHCTKGFPLKHLLLIHKYREHGVEDEEKLYFCSDCDQVFYVQCMLTRHENVVHRKIKRFQCPMCQKSFGTRYSMQNHFRCHTNEKPHQCPVCSKSYSDRSNLIHHARKSHPDIDIMSKSRTRHQDHMYKKPKRNPENQMDGKPFVKKVRAKVQKMDVANKLHAPVNMVNNQQLSIVNEGQSKEYVAVHYMDSGCEQVAPIQIEPSHMMEASSLTHRNVEQVHLEQIIKSETTLASNASMTMAVPVYPVKDETPPRNSDVIELSNAIHDVVESSYVEAKLMDANSDDVKPVDAVTRGQCEVPSAPHVENVIQLQMARDVEVAQSNVVETSYIIEHVEQECEVDSTIQEQILISDDQCYTIGTSCNEGEASYVVLDVNGQLPDQSGDVQYVFIDESEIG